MSKFAATRPPFPESLSPADKTISEIIDAFSNANYAFWDVYVRFSIWFPLKLLGLRSQRSFDGFGLSRKYNVQNRSYEMLERRQTV